MFSNMTGVDDAMTGKVNSRSGINKEQRSTFLGS